MINKIIKRGVINMSDMSSTLSNNNDIFSFNIDNITNDQVGGFNKRL